MTVDHRIVSQEEWIAVRRREAERITRLSDSRFQPRDGFCAMWHLMDLFPESAAGWRPKYEYD